MIKNIVKSLLKFSIAALVIMYVPFFFGMLFKLVVVSFKRGWGMF